METSILALQNLNKTFVLGRSKNARKALKALQKLEVHYETAARHGDKDLSLKLNARLRKAQQAFNDEQYDASYHVATNKHLKHRKDKGLVVHALRHINLTIAPGELVAVVGPSGSGKSTLLNMLGLLDDPTSGHVRLRDKDLATVKRSTIPGIRSHDLGFVFQAFNLVTTLTALENVMLPLKYGNVPRNKRRQMATEALFKVGLGKRLHHTPNELSGGQQQRVAIARAIVNHPAVIFGDELTGELDSGMTTEIMDLISKLNAAGQTFVIVTHNPEVAARCKRTIYMRDGRIERDEAAIGG